MSLPFNPAAPIVEPRTGRGAQFFLQYLQNLFKGVIPRTIYTYAEIALMTPTLGHTVVCSDSSVVTIGNTLAGGGANIVQAIGNGSAWRVI